TGEARAARAEAARRISRSGTQNHSSVASSAAELAVTACAPTLTASFCAFRRDCGESRATISVIVKPAASSATARKVARLPAPTMAIVGFAVVLPALGFPAMNLPAIVFRLSVRLSVRLNRAAYLIL